MRKLLVALSLFAIVVECLYAQNSPYEREDISPMLSTQWGMDAPYNSMCPSNYPSGCTAVASSQVMRYYKYPEKGAGSISYTSGTTQLETDFTTSIYNWEAMPNKVKPTSDETAKIAVALLMKDVGYACKMQYNNPESTGYPYDMGYGLATYFDYDKSVRFIIRKMYSDAEWDSIIYNEIAEGRPVVYSGYLSSNGGHTFVLDGYKEGKYHVNWGWNGQYDGYYALDNLFGYNYRQEALIGITPNKGTKHFQTVLYNFANFETESETYTRSENIKFMGQFTNRSLVTKTFRFGVECIKKSNGESSFVESTVDNTRDPLYYYSNFQVSCSNMPKSTGTYYVYPAYKDDQGIWHRMRTDIELQSNVTAKITSSKITFSEGVPDAINNITQDSNEKSSTIYTINGTSLNTMPSKGIFIKGGKKFISSPH